MMIKVKRFDLLYPKKLADSGDGSGPLPLPVLPVSGARAALGAVQPDGGGDHERGGRHGRHRQGRQQGRPGERRQAQEVNELQY